MCNVFLKVQTEERNSLDGNSCFATKRSSKEKGVRVGMCPSFGRESVCKVMNILYSTKGLVQDFITSRCSGGIRFIREADTTDSLKYRMPIHRDVLISSRVSNINNSHGHENHPSSGYTLRRGGKGWD